MEEPSEVFAGLQEDDLNPDGIAGGGGEAPPAAENNMDRLFVNEADFYPSADDGGYPLYADPTYRMPDVIEVKVDTADDSYSFHVTVQKTTARKLYLGGFRNKKTGAIYHNASSQTPSENKRMFVDNGNLLSRETQTYETRTCSIQTIREFGTQMKRLDLYIDEKDDRVIVAKTYYTSAQLGEDKRVKAIEIQRCWRGHVARSRAARVKKTIIATEKKEFEDR
jgi:hypothetical protein